MEEFVFGRTWSETTLVNPGVDLSLLARHALNLKVKVCNLILHLLELGRVWSQSFIESASEEVWRSFVLFGGRPGGRLHAAVPIGHAPIARAGQWRCGIVVLLSLSLSRVHGAFLGGSRI